MIVQTPEYNHNNHSYIMEQQLSSPTNSPSKSKVEAKNKVINMSYRTRKKEAAALFV